MLIAAILTASGLMYLSYSITESMSNAQNAAIIGVIGLFLGYFYTAKPIRLVSRRGLGEIAIFLAFGPLLTLGSLFAISTSTIELFSVDFYNAIYLGIPLGLLTTNILYINQFPDANSDSKTGKNHLVVTLGKKIARWGYLIILLGAFLAEVAVFIAKMLGYEDVEDKPNVDFWQRLENGEVLDADNMFSNDTIK